MKYNIDDKFQKISDNDTKYTIMDTTSNGWYVLMYDGQPDMEDFVLWTEDEIDEMLEPIPEETPTRWRAGRFDWYWYVGACGAVSNDHDSRVGIDNMRYELGNYFKTEEEAQKASDWLKAFATLRDDTKGFKPDWKNEKQKKWYVDYNRFYDLLNVIWYTACQSSTIIFANEEDAEASIEKHEKEWLTYFGLEGR